MAGLIIFCLLLFILSCGGPDNHLNVPVVRHSSEMLICDKIFAESLKAIEERNEILLQTGSINTTDEHPPLKSAIVTIDNNEIALTLITTNTLHAETTEKYEGNGYSLTLTYQSSNGQYDKLIYSGKVIIENNGSQKKFEVEGKKCGL